MRSTPANRVALITPRNDAAAVAIVFVNAAGIDVGTSGTSVMMRRIALAEKTESGSSLMVQS